MTERLPARRLNTVEVIGWQGLELRIDFGWTREGRIAELFGDGLKSGSALELALAEGCVLVSWLLEHGVAVEEIGRRLRRLVPGPLGAAIERAIVLEVEQAQGIREAYGWAAGHKPESV